MAKYLTLKIPRKFVKVGLSKGRFLALTNYNKGKRDRIDIPLPKGKWELFAKKGSGTIILKDSRNLIQRFFRL